MTTPIESVVKVAATPSQAKIYVAMLQAAGIPARVDGDSLVDEFAAARRLVNLMGTQVMVPTGSLELARDVLQPANVDQAELERQALAATDAESVAQRPTKPATTTSSSSELPWLLLVLLPLLAAVAYALVA
jgi:hypothetical protein